MARLSSLLVVSHLFPVHVTMADDATVLPRGMWHLSADARFSLPVTKHCTPSDGTEDLAADVNRDRTSTRFS
jgi:ABC-type glutathione transport system ATPase component